MQSIILVVEEKKPVEEFIKKNFSKEDIIIFLSPEKNEYSIDQIRYLQKEVKYFTQKKRVFVLYKFNSASLEAQNAFLKLLEEPPTNVYFLLVCQNLYKLLPTIVSRAKVIDLKNKTIKIIDEQIIELVKKIKNRQLFFISVLDRKEAQKLILSLIYYFKEELKKDLRIYPILKEAIKNLSLLENNYLNPQLTLDNLIIFINKCYNEIK